MVQIKSRFFIFFALLLFTFMRGTAQQPILPGASRLDEYVSLLRGKNVALVVNNTAEVQGVLLPDTLLKRGIRVVKIFSPEHGFRGTADAGATVENGKDPVTGLPVISLYGNHKKPSANDLRGIDIVVYDIQDVGVRFYTYISTLQYVLEACGAQDVPVMILDRPDPLGFIVDGPVLQKEYRSFVGLQPVPVVYGMTPGEYARMLIGEKWLSGPAPDLQVIRCENYTHQSLYELPVMPSPNLKNMAAIYLYPSLCLFEGTVISVGRGTDRPFQQFGNPKLRNQPHHFIPRSMPGATTPPFEKELCYGRLVATTAEEALTAIHGTLNLEWLISAYNSYPDQKAFFTAYFNNLAGNDRLKQQIVSGMTAAQIRQSWQPDLEKFRKIRAGYLLYP